MRSLLLVLLALVGCSCAKHENKVEIDPLIQPYLDQFVQDAKSYGIEIKVTDLVMKFQDLGAGTGTVENGRCETGPNQTPTVLINNNPRVATWGPNDDKTFNEILVYHELGHCLLGREHNTNMWIQLNAMVTLPESVMYPSLPQSDFYLPYRQHYMDELFKGAQQWKDIEEPQALQSF